MERGAGRLGVGEPPEGRAGRAHSFPLAFTGILLRSRDTQGAPGPLCRSVERKTAGRQWWGLPGWRRHLGEAPVKWLLVG